MPQINAAPPAQPPVPLTTPYPTPSPSAQAAAQNQPTQSITPALGGPSYVNNQDGARIVSDGPTVAVQSRSGNTISYISASDSFMLQRASNGERLGSLGNHIIGLDERNIEVAVDQQRNVKILTPDGKWNDFGSIQDEITQQRLAQVIDPQAQADLNRVVTDKGSLGGLDYKSMGLAPSSIQSLNDAQELNRRERLQAQRAAVKARTLDEERQSPAPEPILPFDTAVAREGPPPAGLVAPHIDPAAPQGGDDAAQSGTG